MYERGIKFGSAKPMAADSTVMTISAPSAPVKMTRRLCFMAMMAAQRECIEMRSERACVSKTHTHTQEMRVRTGNKECLVADFRDKDHGDTRDECGDKRGLVRLLAARKYQRIVTKF